MTSAHSNKLLTVSGLRKTFSTKNGPIKAVDNVDFDVGVAETVAVVGESGCGKSTLAFSVLGLVPADEGSVILDGEELHADAKKLRKRMGREIGIVFQNPHSALNPKMRVRAIVGEPLVTVNNLRGRELTDRVTSLLEDIGMGAQHLNRYPHEFSGGQRQRIAIARALALQPKLLILDEPTAALDVSVQAQVLKLLKELQDRHAVSYLFITHDLGTVDYLADRVVVMYLGRIVETGSVDQVFKAPKHPYTRALLDSVPSIDLSLRGKMKIVSGEVPSPLDRPPGCAFAPRCGQASDECRTTVPDPRHFGDGRIASCLHPLDT